MTQNRNDGPGFYLCHICTLLSVENHYYTGALAQWELSVPTTWSNRPSRSAQRRNSTRSTRISLGAGYLTFAMPWPLFLEMEDNVEGSFLERPTWASLQLPEA